MKTFQWTLLVIVLFGALVTACESADTNTEMSEPDAMVKETPKTEETAKPELDDEQYVKLAEVLRQTTNEALGKTIDQAVYKYDCDGWGGSLTLGQDGELVVYREHINGGDDGAMTVRFYNAQKKGTTVNLYDDDNTVVCTWTLSKRFAGEKGTVAETIYYLRKDVLVKAIQRKAKGTAETIDKNLAAAEFMPIKGDAVSDHQVLYRDLLELDVENVQTHFCE